MTLTLAELAAVPMADADEALDVLVDRLLEDGTMTILLGGPREWANSSDATSDYRRAAVGWIAWHRMQVECSHCLHRHHRNEWCGARRWDGGFDPVGTVGGFIHDLGRHGIEPEILVGIDPDPKAGLVFLWLRRIDNSPIPDAIDDVFRKAFHDFLPAAIMPIVIPPPLASLT